MQQPHGKIGFAVIFTVIKIMFKLHIFCNYLIHVGLSPAERKTWRNKVECFFPFFPPIAFPVIPWSLTIYFSSFLLCYSFFSNWSFQLFSWVGGVCHWRHACEIKKVELGHPWKQTRVFHRFVLGSHQESSTDLLRKKKKN